MVTNRKFKYGQLFTYDNCVYQVLETPPGFLSCEYCELINESKYCCTAPHFNCADLIPARAYLKRIK